VEAYNWITLIIIDLNIEGEGVANRANLGKNKEVADFDFLLCAILLGMAFKTTGSCTRSVGVYLHVIVIPPKHICIGASVSSVAAQTHDHVGSDLDLV